MTRDQAAYDIAMKICNGSAMDMSFAKVKLALLTLVTAPPSAGGEVTCPAEVGATAPSPSTRPEIPGVEELAEAIRTEWHRFHDNEIQAGPWSSCTKDVKDGWIAAATISHQRIAAALANEKAWSKTLQGNYDLACKTRDEQAAALAKAEERADDLDVTNRANVKRFNECEAKLRKDNNALRATVEAVRVLNDRVKAAHPHTVAFVSCSDLDRALAEAPAGDRTPERRAP